MPASADIVDTSNHLFRMHTYQHHIAELKHSPQLPKAIEELNAFWQDDQQRRVQFYNDIDEDSKAEFVEGVVIMHSPAKDAHNETRALIDRLISTHADVHGLGKVRSEKALIALSRNDFEPDVVFWSAAKAAAIGPQTLKYPAPDWVCEVLSPGTERYDRGIKMNDYAAHDVAEYWIIDPDKRVAEIYLLQDDKQYGLHTKTDSGILRSTVIPGFECPIEAIFDTAANIIAVRRILQS